MEEGTSETYHGIGRSRPRKSWIFTRCRRRSCGVQLELLHVGQEMHLQLDYSEEDLPLLPRLQSTSRLLGTDICTWEYGADTYQEVGVEV